MAKWDPAQYERYKTYRDRPALDLLVQIPQDLEPDEIWDLGCGTGEHAALLARRHPGAKVYGLDSSPDMLVDARARTAPVTWIEDSIANFAPRVAPDLIFTNAALQWLPDHATLFPRLVSTLAPGGVFACQVPQAHNNLWHQELRDTAAEAPWADRLQGLDTVQPTASPEAYFDWLSPLAEVDIWTTAYLHVLTGENPVVDWMMGTGLRPYLTALADDPATRDAFLASYSAKIARDFPMRPDGTTLIPFPRLFIIARRR